MRQSVFAARNIYDKLTKVVGDWNTLRFYWQHYVLSRFDVAEPDLYIVSYPKCGRTWLRVLLQKYLALLDLPLEHYHDRTLLGIAGDRLIKFEHDQGNWVPAPPRIDQLAFDTAKYAGKKVVFLVRDPRDVLVSSWYHLRYREHIYPHDLATFIRDDLVGIEKVIAFMNMWIEHRHVPEAFYLTTYEQMHETPMTVLEAVLPFLGLAVDREALEQAIAESTFSNMKRMERDGVLKEPWMKPGAKHLRESMKVRKGKVGSFREELSDESIAFLNDRIRHSLSDKLPYRNV